jgi:hypothetical protein
LPARIELGMMVAQALIELKYSGEGILPWNFKVSFELYLDAKASYFTTAAGHPD